MREKSIQGRLLAPCCWNQTLDIHDSELASSLRREIHSRVIAGESSLSIEDDLAARYGERIRAVPRGRDPRQGVAAMVFASMMVACLGLLGLAVRWVKRTKAEVPSKTTGVSLDGYDARLDEELENLE